jgi:two-component system chemotaxis response regulator CheB
MKKPEIVVIGVSAGGMQALQKVLPHLPQDFPIPVVILQHVHASQSGYYIQHFNSLCKMTVSEAEPGVSPQPGCIYFAPPNYHLLIEPDKHFSLSVDQRVHYARPSIDVLFMSAADAYDASCLGIILTGANSDGAEGLKSIIDTGGSGIIQDPKEADYAAMPMAAHKACPGTPVLSLQKITEFLQKIAGSNQ